MAYLIDGHNLIPKAGLRLDDPEDEQKLLDLLQNFNRLSRKKVEVFFDRAPAGHANTRRFGSVTAHFIDRGSSADAAIITRLRKLGPAAANWTVVSSDLRVQAEARACRASIFSSEDFVRQMNQAHSYNPPAKVETKMSDDELEEWLKIFREKK